MSVPTFALSGNTTQATGGTNVVWPVGHQADDIGILYVQTSNETVATPSGWTLAGNAGTGTPGAAGSTAVWAFWKRATSAAEADAIVADAGDHIKCRILVFRGCETSGSPFDVSATGTLAAADTACSIPGVTTTVADTLVLFAVANATDISGANQTSASGFANSNLANVTRIMTSNTSSGNGGGIDVASGEKATPGATGNTTVTLVTASAQALLTLALKPPAVVGGGVTEGGIYVATGVKATIGVVGATVATLDAASAQGRMTIALKPPVSAPVNTAPVITAITDKTVRATIPLEFPIQAVDAEGDVITFSLEAGATAVPSGAVVVQDGEDGSWSFQWTPTGDQAGEWNLTVRATDDDVSPLSSTATFTITVTPAVSRPPFGSAVNGGLNSIV